MTHGSDPEDAALVRRLLAKDEEAFALLVERYHLRLIRLARLFVADRGAAEEVAQETWLAVLRGLPAFESRSSLKTWIFRILVNRAKTRAVRDKRMVTFSMLAEEGGDEPAVEADRFTAEGRWLAPPRRWEDDTPEAALLRGEALGVLEQTLGELPPAQKAVVTMRDVEGLDAAEVCNALEISETNQRVLLHRGRSRLRRALEKYGAGRSEC